MVTGETDHSPTVALDAILAINFSIKLEIRALPSPLTRTTLTLPADLLARVDQAVRQGRARSRNAFVATALERDLAALERAALDAEFAGMGEDEAYLAESQRLDAEFEAAGAEALRLAEGRT